jgi:hypothetical protein
MNPASLLAGEAFDSGVALDDFEVDAAGCGVFYGFVLVAVVCPGSRHLSWRTWAL